jgi:hypothetical protein
MGQNVTMSQTVNLLLLSLARACPSARVSITSLGPIEVKNGVARFGAATKTELQLSDIKRPELQTPIEQLRAEAAHKLAKKVNHTGGRSKR